MSILPIKIYGEPVLRQKAEPLTQGEIDEDFRQTILDMGETMYASNGVGLAANQVGITKRFFVADVDQVSDQDNRRTRRKKDPERRNLLAFLNPEIIEASTEDIEFTEGCLSIPELEGTVYRPERIRIRYRDLNWEEHEEWIDGYLARVFQHEMDHLDGILFIDLLGEVERRRVAGHLNRLKKQQDEVAVPATAKDES